MKPLNSKSTLALILSALMFGVLSFSTTPVSAQGTFSNFSRDQPVFMSIITAGVRPLVPMVTAEWPGRNDEREIGNNNDRSKQHPLNALD